MSIFSDNVTTEPKIKDAYNFSSIDYNQDIRGLSADEIQSFNYTLANTFSSQKISDYINEHNSKPDGSKIYDRLSFEMFKLTMRENYYYLDKIFIGLVLVLLLSEGLEENYLERIYNSLIQDTRYEQGSRVGIKIIPSKKYMTEIKFWVRSNRTKIRFAIMLEDKYKPTE